MCRLLSPACLPILSLCQLSAGAAPLLLQGAAECIVWPAWWRPSEHTSLPLCALQSLLPPDIVDQQRIRAQLTTALNLMNAAAESSTLPAGQRWAAIDEATEVARANAAAQMGPAAAPVAPTAAKFVADGEAAAAAMTLRQLVEAFAAESDVQLLPKAGQTHEGLQVMTGIQLGNESFLAPLTEAPCSEWPPGA